jgi:hypothetical protein
MFSANENYFWGRDTIVLKIKEAIAIVIQNFLLFSTITLVIWLPLEILFECILFYSLPHKFIINGLIGGIFHCLFNGSILAAMFSIQQGHTIDYSRAISIGFRNWGNLVNVFLEAELHISLRFLALIVPGIVLAIEYSFTESLVIDRGIGKRSMQISKQLTKGRKWEIFLTQLGTWILILLIYAVFVEIQILMDLEDNFVAKVVLECILDLIVVLSPIVNALFYLEAKAIEQNPANSRSSYS